MGAGIGTIFLMLSGLASVSPVMMPSLFELNVTLARKPHRGFHPRRADRHRRRPPRRRRSYRGFGAPTYEATSNNRDFENRLTSVAMTGVGTVSHVYDVDGERVKTTVTPGSGSPSVTNMLVDTSAELSHVVAETDGTGSLKALYVRVGDELFAVLRPAGGGTWTTRYVHHDALGSVRALSDEAGVVTSERGYEAFGVMNVEAGSDPLPYRFAGEPFEATSKLAYHRARWMAPGSGRFYGMDPWEGTPIDPVTLHPFLYAAGNPVSMTDPTGWFFGGISSAATNVGMRILSTMAVATPRLFQVTVTGMTAVAGIARVLNDEFSSGGAVTMNPTSLLSREGVEIAKTVAEVKPVCTNGRCLDGVKILRAKLAELFSSLTTRTVAMQPGRGMGRAFQVTERVQRAVPGSSQGWGIHVAVELEGGQIIDPTIGRVFRNRQEWKEWIVGIENMDTVVTYIFGN